MKIDRLIGILSILLQEEKTTAPELAERFEVSRRTINRDIEDLCKAGIPIKTAQGTSGGISIMDGYRMDRTILSSKDMQMILAGLRSLDSVSGSRYYSQLMEKIQTGSSEFISGRDSMLIDLSSWYKGSLAPKIEVIQSAIENRRIIRFKYYAPSGESNRRIEPYYLVFRWSSWYVWGWCLERKDYRLFKLNRMDCVVETDRGFLCRDVPMPDLSNEKIFPGGIKEFPIVKDTTPNMMNPRLYTTSYNKPQGQQFDTAVLSFIKLQYTEKSCKMINIFVLVTILGHLPVILSAKSKGSEDMKQILIVEDDSFLNKMLAYNLTADGYGVTSALNARTAADAIRQREFDLVLLDINLPDGNGFELCKLIKPQHPDTIVIFLTANDQESDQIRGYEVGAVDYITKPFVIGALQRKIKAMFAMLEHHKPAKDIYDDGRLFLDFSEQTASLNGKPLTLSPMEYKMLNLFRKNPRQVLTRGQLLEKLWDIDERFVDEHTLTTSISRIRSKIESDGGAPYIKTVYGMGYQWTGGEAK